MSGIRISRIRIPRLMPPVTNIHRPLFVLILLLDSNVESSNMASLGDRVSLLLLDTTGGGNVPGLIIHTKERVNLIRTSLPLPRLLQNWCNLQLPEVPPGWVHRPLPGISATSVSPLTMDAQIGLRGHVF